MLPQFQIFKYCPTYINGNIIYFSISKTDPFGPSCGPGSHICASDLCLSGKDPKDEYLEAMMTEAPGPINFTMFLTMFGEKLNGTDPEEVIRNAFACFDEEGTGEHMVSH